MSARDEDDFSAASSLRIPPHSREAEQSVLGGLLLDNVAWDRVGDVLVEADFYRHEHRTIFATIGAMISSTRTADCSRSKTVITSAGKADDCGGLAYLNAMAASVPSAANIRGYATIVRERAVQRKLIATLDDAATIAWGDGPLAEKMDQVSSKINSLERGQTTKLPTALADIFVRRLDRITALHQGEEKSGWPTMLPQLNTLLNGGLQPGGVYVLAARPSVGKSALAAAIGLDLALREGMPVLFLSQEMGEDELGDRALANIAGIDYSRIQTGQLQDIEWGNLSTGVETGAHIPFFIDDQPALTLMQIRSKARMVKGLKLLVLDYLQLSEASADHRGNRNGAVEEISRGLKQLAKEMGIAVLLLSQLNRKVEERPHKRPILADLRDSGAIEQDADVVIFLFPIKELKQEQCMEIGLDIPKNRQGRKGAFALNFWGAHMRWGESSYRLSELLKSRAGDGDGFE
jgi:replicative DNA helicase